MNTTTINQKISSGASNRNIGLSLGAQACVVLATLLSFIFISPAYAKPDLHGVGVHQELGRDVFLGALYSDVKTDDSAKLLSSTNNMRMELRVVSRNGLSKRRFARMWIEGVAINNPSADLTRSAENLFSFTKLFGSKLSPGDTIAIEMTRDRPVVEHNGVRVGELANNRLFGLLLSTWLGPVPVSNAFKRGLLAHEDVDQKLLTTFNTTRPTASRVAEVKAYKEVLDAEAPAEDIAVAVVEPIAKPKPQPKVVKKTPKPTKKPVKKVAPTKAPRPKQVVKATPKPRAVPKAAKPPVKTTIAKARPTPRDENELTVDSLLSSQRYFTDMSRKVSQRVSYPSIAKTRKQQGTVKVVVVVDRNGRLLRAEPIVETRYKILNREAVAAVKRAAPFPAVPASLKGKRHEFNVPVVFELDK